MTLRASWTIDSWLHHRYAPLSYTDTMVLVDVPALTPGGVSVVVSVVGRSSNSIDFVGE